MSSGSRSKKAYDLEAMVARITPDTLHAEVDSGAPRGNEEW